MSKLRTHQPPQIVTFGSGEMRTVRPRNEDNKKAARRRLLGPRLRGDNKNPARAGFYYWKVFPALGRIMLGPVGGINAKKDLCDWEQPGRFIAG